MDNPTSADQIQKRIPDSAGFYFGRSTCQFQYYNLIIRVSGEAPMLYISGFWNVVTDALKKSPYPWDVWFGPKIEVPEVPRSEYVK